MGRSASGSPYSAPKAPNAPQGAADYSFLSGIYGAAYGRKQGADFARPTNLVRKKPKLESIINPNQPIPDTSVGGGSGREGIFRPDVAGEETPPSDGLATQTETEGVDYDALQDEFNNLLGDLQTDDEAFEDYLESDDYVQTTAGGGSTTMEDAAADPFDTSVTTMDDVPTMEEGIADTSGGMLDEDPEDVVMTGDEVPTLDEAIADTTDDFVMTSDEVPTMDEYLADLADQDAQDRVKFEDLLDVQAKSFDKALSIREYNNLIQNRIKALDESTATVTSAQLQAEQAEIERLQGLTEQNALEEGYEKYLESYVSNMVDRKASGQEFFTQLENATRLRDERQFDDLFYGDIYNPDRYNNGGIGQGEGLYADEIKNQRSTGLDLSDTTNEVVTTSEETEVVTTPEETESTVPDEPESVVLSPEEQWYTENYPELQKQITERYNIIKNFLEEERGLEEGTIEFNAMLEKNRTYQALIAQRSGLYFREVLFNP